MKKLLFAASVIAMTGFIAQPVFAGNHGGCKSKNCTCKGNCKDEKCTMACCTGGKSCKKGDKKCTKDSKKDAAAGDKK